MTSTTRVTTASPRGATSSKNLPVSQPAEFENLLALTEAIEITPSELISAQLGNPTISNSFCQPLPEAEREALAKDVASAFEYFAAKLAEHKSDIERLWWEFENLKPGETIMDCGTKKEFCAKVLKRSLRAVQYLLSGGNPVSRRGRSETVSPSMNALSTKQRNRLFKEAAIVGELVPAFEAGHEIVNHIRELKRISLSPAELSCIIESEERPTPARVQKEIQALAYRLAAEALRSGSPQMQPIAFELLALLEPQMENSKRDDERSRELTAKESSREF